MREVLAVAEIDATDRAIIDHLQGGFPICERPYAQTAGALGIGEDELLERLQRMLDARVLTRFGPMFQVERMGGAFVLAAMCVPEANWQQVVDTVNAFPAVAHNYRRESDRGCPFNMWFVLATDTVDGIDAAAARIEAETGLAVNKFPKLDEYFIGLRVDL